MNPLQLIVDTVAQTANWQKFLKISRLPFLLFQSDSNFIFQFRCSNLNLIAFNFIIFFLFIIGCTEELLKFVESFEYFWWFVLVFQNPIFHYEKTKKKQTLSHQFASTLLVTNKHVWRETTNSEFILIQERKIKNSSS